MIKIEIAVNEVDAIMAALAAAGDLDDLTNPLRWVAERIALATNVPRHPRGADATAACHQ